ncbi:MAG: HlyD family efflux transporter periplasmic adaptor subunit [Alphaproteobacteria bacterium]|nr:HlyD family efflux transporter periplasmic adaptor subunit [Alphaproteobacteria bacterium]
MDEFLAFLHAAITWFGEAFAWTMAALGVLIGMVGAFAASFVESGPPVYNGYVEANYVYVAATNPGRLRDIAADEGQTVTQGQTLFSLDDDQYRAALSAAVAQQKAAEASWRNLETGSRSEETDVIKASLKQAEANLELARTTLDRTLKLKQSGLVPDSRVDSAQAQFDTTSATLAQLQAQLAVAELPARPEQLEAAKANYEAAAANVELAQVQLDDRTVDSPVGGVVDRVYYKAGEVVGTGSPVLSILPPGELKVEFFLPETERNRFRIGDILDVTCDSCADELTATISYLASDPQHTPPIIYSRDERKRLVFMAEARIDESVSLLPGQPVTMKVPE